MTKADGPYRGYSTSLRRAAVAAAPCGEWERPAGMQREFNAWPAVILGRWSRESLGKLEQQHGPVGMYY